MCEGNQQRLPFIFSTALKLRYNTWESYTPLGQLHVPSRIATATLSWYSSTLTDSNSYTLLGQLYTPGLEWAVTTTLSWDSNSYTLLGQLYTPGLAQAVTATLSWDSNSYTLLGQLYTPGLAWAVTATLSWDSCIHTTLPVGGVALLFQEGQAVTV